MIDLQTALAALALSVASDPPDTCLIQATCGRLGLEPDLTERVLGLVLDGATDHDCFTELSLGALLVLCRAADASAQGASPASALQQARRAAASLPSLCPAAVRQHAAGRRPRNRTHRPWRCAGSTR